MSLTSDNVRKMFREGDDKRDAGLTSPEDVERFDNIVYGEDAVWQSLDVYCPKEEKGKMLPVIVSVHGGAWVYGDKERYQYYCMSLAQRGFAVVNFTYRLAPEYKFPSSLEDTNSVFEWVLEHADQYGFDVKHIFAVGDSAGAHILSIYAAVWSNPFYAAEYPFKVPEGLSLKAIALNCGAYKIEVKPDMEEDLTTMLMGDFLPEKGSRKELMLINVANHVTEAFPPVFVMTADGDFLKYQAAHLAEKLYEKNIPFVSRYYRNPEMTLGHVFHCNIRLEDAKLCNDEECNFFKTFIK